LISINALSRVAAQSGESGGKIAFDGKANKGAITMRRRNV
jgi:hypothetical protein